MFGFCGNVSDFVAIATLATRHSGPESSDFVAMWRFNLLLCQINDPSGLIATRNQPKVRILLQYANKNLLTEWKQPGGDRRQKFPQE
jgi:hypothetical protein